MNIDITSRLRGRSFIIHLFSIRLNLVKSLIIPLFTYCDYVFAAELDSFSKPIILRAFNASIRYVCRLCRYSILGVHHIFTFFYLITVQNVHMR